MPGRKSSPPASTHPVRPLASSHVRLVSHLRAICLALPEANERVSHGEPTWFAGKGKSFAMLDNHHHDAPHLGVWLPQPPEIQQSLIEADPARFFRPPYVGPRGWVGVVLENAVDWDMVTSLVHEAYRHVATQKLIARMTPMARTP